MASPSASSPPTDPPPARTRWRPLTPRERRFWVLAVGFLLFLYASAHFVGELMRWLRDRGDLRATVTAIFVVAALALGGWLITQRPGRRELAVLAVGAAIYPLAASQMNILQERLHLVQYGVLGGLFLAALRERRRSMGDRPRGLAKWPARSAFVLAALGGWGDELVQGLLPKRYYDLRDVAFNAGAAALLIALAEAREWARGRDAPAAEEAHGSGQG